VDLAELSGEQWLLAAPEAYETFRRACHTAGFEPLTSHDLSEWAGMVYLMRAGEGVALVSPLTPLPDGLVHVPLRGSPQRRDLVLGWRAGTEVAEHAGTVLTSLGRRYLAAVVGAPVYHRWWRRHRAKPRP
jgi:hypothetical protein